MGELAQLERGIEQTHPHIFVGVRFLLTVVGVRFFFVGVRFFSFLTVVGVRFFFAKQLDCPLAWWTTWSSWIGPGGEFDRVKEGSLLPINLQSISRSIGSLVRYSKKLPTIGFRSFRGKCARSGLEEEYI